MRQILIAAAHLLVAAVCSAEAQNFVSHHEVHIHHGRHHRDVVHHHSVGPNVDPAINTSAPYGRSYSHVYNAAPPFGYGYGNPYGYRYGVRYSRPLPFWYAY